MKLRSRQIQTTNISEALQSSKTSDTISKKQRKRPATTVSKTSSGGSTEETGGTQKSKQSRMVSSCKQQNNNNNSISNEFSSINTLTMKRTTRSNTLKNVPSPVVDVEDQPPPPKKKSSISKINSGLNLLRKSSSSLFTLRVQQNLISSTSSQAGFDGREDSATNNRKDKQNSRKDAKTAWTESLRSSSSSQITMGEQQKWMKSSSRLLRTTSSSSSTTSSKTTIHRESNILTKDQKKRVEKLLKKFSKKQQHKNKQPIIVDTSDEETVHCRGKRRQTQTANSSSIHVEEYYRPDNAKQRKRSRQHVNMIITTLEDYGDGSTLTDLMDYSRITCETEHCTLLVLHALKEAIKTSQVMPYKDMFVREECYEDFLEDEKQRDEELKMNKKLMKKNSITKNTFKSRNNNNNKHHGRTSSDGKRNVNQKYAKK